MSKSVNIAKFKAELGKYLGYVRKGEEVVVFDRKDPMARVIPFEPRAKHKLSIEEATLSAGDLFAMRVSPIAGLKTKSLEFLMEERAER